jgi:hypothetical protein
MMKDIGFVLMVISVTIYMHYKRNVIINFIEVL